MIFHDIAIYSDDKYYSTICQYLSVNKVRAELLELDATHKSPLTKPAIKGTSARLKEAIQNS